MFRGMVTALAVLGSLAVSTAYAQTAQVTAPAAPASANLPKPDYANAIPLPFPHATTAPGLSSTGSVGSLGGSPGISLGATGNGQMTPVTLFAPKTIKAAPQSGAAPQEYGSSGQPYTTSRVNGYTAPTTNYYPFRAVGQLTFNIQNSPYTYYCTASLIKPGIIVTAAHCVTKFGSQQFYYNWTFIPAFQNGMAPYGTWQATNPIALQSYFAGSDSCYQSGVVCTNDVALLSIVSQNNTLPGNATGWLNYSWDGYGFNGSSQVLITQLGYPLALDNGVFMERTDSQGFISSSMSNNTVIGSLQTGGSSGGPWVENVGRDPILGYDNDDQTTIQFGNAAVHNTIAGVTSWGYTNQAVKQQGASHFTSGNIVLLVNTQCQRNPNKC